MTITAAEQYLLELMNRARLDPAGEAARMGTTLNAGLTSGSISTAAKQVLAPNALLDSAATGHSLWMLATDVFSHTGAAGSQPWDRANDEGYFGGIGENIAVIWSTGPLSVEGSIDRLNQNLFLSAGHRANLMREGYREVGLAAEAGPFTSGGTTFNSAMLTEVFGATGASHFLTGVAYQDRNANQFYSMGEGGAGVQFAAQGSQTMTAAAGGYALGLTAGAAVAVTGQAGALTFALTVDMRPGNVKLDLVNGDTFYTSGSVVLGTGVMDVVLLGVASLNATGTAQGNDLTGNAGANVLTGLAGQDVLTGAGGADRLLGGRGNDRMNGGGGADDFVFGQGDGRDRIAGFTNTADDELHLSAQLWAGQTLVAGQVVQRFATVQADGVLFDFGSDEVLLAGVTTLDGLADQIVIF